ncbi:MAG: type II secretion system F family protein [bacterium]
MTPSIVIEFLTFVSVVLFVYACCRMIQDIQQVPMGEDGFFGLEGSRAGRNPLYRATMALVRLVAKVNLSWNMAGYEDVLRRRLDAAGRPLDLKPMEYLALCELSAVLFVLLGISLYISFPSRLSVFALLAFGALGFFVPGLYLMSLTKKRQFYILRDLPFCCDLLTLAVEAGLDFGSGLERVVANGPPGPLRDELKFVIQETRLGKSRREALMSLAERVQMQEISHFVGAVVQADRMGTGLASVMRIQSAQMRNRRFERAEKAAQKVPVKILFPIIIANLLSIAIILIVPLLSAIRQVGL